MTWGLSSTSDLCAQDSGQGRGRQGRRAQAGVNREAWWVDGPCPDLPALGPLLLLVETP